MIIGIVLVLLALGVLFDKLPGAEVAWLVVLVCGLILVAGAALPSIPWRRPPSA